MSVITFDSLFENIRAEAKARETQTESVFRWNKETKDFDDADSLEVRVTLSEEEIVERFQDTFLSRLDKVTTFTQDQLRQVFDILTNEQKESVAKEFWLG